MKKAERVGQDTKLIIDIHVNVSEDRMMEAIAKKIFAASRAGEYSVNISLRTLKNAIVKPDLFNKTLETCTNNLIDAGYTVEKKTFDLDENYLAISWPESE